ncbi:axonemal dynein heavy chain protein [Elysia marginata]|uniref:Axonemal dynein heavy chain protein n=1 Tax=Elysia marginata TaxID=1093978 RepID=A0AAV4FMI1_9GAST|nr:axonemal dynein heavy chain protein [Elysia marginata]
MYRQDTITGTRYVQTGQENKHEICTDRTGEQIRDMYRQDRRTSTRYVQAGQKNKYEISTDRTEEQVQDMYRQDRRTSKRYVKAGQKNKYEICTGRTEEKGRDMYMQNGRTSMRYVQTGQKNKYKICTGRTEEQARDVYRLDRRASTRYVQAGQKNKQEICSGRTEEQARDMFLEKQSRHNYVTPTSYLELINAFKNLLRTQQEQTMKAKRRYLVGLEKLAFASSQVATMQEELELLQPQLVVSAEETNRMMVIIESESASVEETSKRVKADEAVANESAAEAKSLKDECEAELAEALPALEAALAALDTLKPADITIVKSMKSPPSGVKLVMAAVCLCKWILAMEIYDRVAKVVAPKKLKLKTAETELDKMMDKLNKKRAELKAVEDKLAGLQATFAEMKNKKETLENQVDLCGKKLERSQYYHSVD